VARGDDEHEQERARTTKWHKALHCDTEGFEVDKDIDCDEADDDNRTVGGEKVPDDGGYASATDPDKVVGERKRRNLQADDRDVVFKLFSPRVKRLKVDKHATKIGVGSDGERPIPQDPDATFDGSLKRAKLSIADDLEVAAYLAVWAECDLFAEAAVAVYLTEEIWARFHPEKSSSLLQIVGTWQILRETVLICGDYYITIRNETVKICIAFLTTTATASTLSDASHAHGFHV
jgi:hypothetical protein